MHLDVCVLKEFEAGEKYVRSRQNMFNQTMNAMYERTAHHCALQRTDGMRIEIGTSKAN